MHNIIYMQQKGSGGDRINIAIEHNLVQPNKYLLNKLKGKKKNDKKEILIIVIIQ